MSNITQRTPKLLQPTYQIQRHRVFFNTNRRRKHWLDTWGSGLSPPYQMYYHTYIQRCADHNSAFAKYQASGPATLRVGYKFQHASSSLCRPLLNVRYITNWYNFVVHVNHIATLRPTFICNTPSMCNTIDTYTLQMCQADCSCYHDSQNTI